MSNAEKASVRETFRDLWICPIVLLLILTFVIASIVGILHWNQSIGLIQKLTMDNYSKLFVNLFIITVIVERFIEVFISIWRRKGKLKRTRAVQYAEDGEPKQAAQKKLDSYRARTQTLAMYGAFAIGILVGLSGVHTLKLIFDITSLSGSQAALFHGMDILLTAGLIAGGSKGINAVTAVVGEALEKSREKVSKEKTGGEAAAAASDSDE